MFDLHVSNTGQRTKMPLESCQGSSLDLILPSSRCKPYFFALETSTFYYQSEPATLYVWVTGLRFSQAQQWNTNVNFLLWMFLSWLMVSRLLKMMLFVSQSLIMDFSGFFSTQMKTHLLSSAVFLPSLAVCVSVSWSPEVPREGNTVLHESFIECQWKICSTNWKQLKGNIQRLLLLPQPIWL